MVMEQASKPMTGLLWVFGDVSFSVWHWNLVINNVTQLEAYGSNFVWSKVMAKSYTLVWGVQKCLEIDVAHPLNLNQQIVLK
jgi:hypothetical protein